MNIKNKLKRKKYQYVQTRLEKTLNLSCVEYEKRETSISDSNQYGYTPFCELAAHDDNIFKNFRHYRVYRGIVEDVGYNIGEGCWEIIKKNNVSADVLKECWKNDSIGGAETYYYNGLKKAVTPATMRYTKIMLDIKELFGEVHNVAEIGIGYGGQSRILRKFNDINSYSLIDIPQALGVAKKYLSNFFNEDEMKKYHFIDGTALDKTITPELIISNYAFSELCREVQDMYLSNVIKNAEKGFITWNELSHVHLDGHSLEEILEMIPGSRTLDEVPLSAEGNKVIVWGTAI